MTASSSARGDIQLVIPMAGEGKRFVERGYAIPKPLLPVAGRPMFELVVRNLVTSDVGSVVVACRGEWDIRIQADRLSEELAIPVSIVEVHGTTDGPAGTVELAAPHLRMNEPVVVANSDQFVQGDLAAFYASIGQTYPGVVLAMEDDDPKWSYVRVNDEGLAEEIREKVLISHLATVGIYGFASAELMLQAFADMRAREDTTNGEYYVAPAYRYLFERRLPVKVINLCPIGDVMHGLGIPDDYTAFLELVERGRVTLPWWTAGSEEDMRDGT